MLQPQLEQTSLKWKVNEATREAADATELPNPGRVVGGFASYAYVGVPKSKPQTCCRYRQLKNLSMDLKTKNEHYRCNWLGLSLDSEL